MIDPERLTVKGLHAVGQARPPKRVIREALALKILDGEIKEGDTVEARVSDGQVVFQVSGATAWPRLCRAAVSSGICSPP